MSKATQQKNRHGAIAEDSRRVCVVIPDSQYRSMHGLRDKRRPTVSSIVREYITVGLQKDIEKNERTQDQSASGIDAH